MIDESELELETMNDYEKEMIPKTLEEAVRTKGVIDAIAYAINHPGVVADVGTDEYNDLLNLFQDWIPFELIDCNQWWLGHYWSSGHTCSKCRELVHWFRCDEQGLDQRLEEAIRNMTSGHAPGCNVRNTCTFDGVKICLALNDAGH